ncbi:MAG: CHAP domain-containing protein [Mycobacteriales bacterium]
MVVATAVAVTPGISTAQNGYHIETHGTALTVRSGPGTGYAAVGTIKDGTPVDIGCQAYGTAVTGTFGTSKVWDRIGKGRFVADTYVYTGHEGKFLATCPKQSQPALKNDYPYSGQTSGIDPWNFYKGQCTSFVAWRLNDRRGINFNNYWRGQHFGNANLWEGAARNLGIAVNNQPKVGAVAQWNSGSYGHVAWVTRVNSNNTVTIEEYNYVNPGHYDYRTLSVGSVENFIHF